MVLSLKDEARVSLKSVLAVKTEGQSIMYGRSGCVSLLNSREEGAYGLKKTSIVLQTTISNYCVAS